LPEAGGTRASWPLRDVTPRQPRPAPPGAARAAAPSAGRRRAVGRPESSDRVQAAPSGGQQLGPAATDIQELADDGQAEPGAVAIGGSAAPEAVEGMLALLGGHARSLVDDVHLDPPVGPAHGKADPAHGRGGAQCIGEQVVQHLVQRAGAP
jgi:hypothetical protein